MKEKIVAAIQMTSGNDKIGNLNKAQKLLEKGVSTGAGILALPENFSFMGSADAEKLQNAEDPEGGPSLDFLKNFSKKHGVWLIGGSIPVKADGGKVFNRTYVVGSDGEIAAHYDKIHLFDVQIPGGESHKESERVEAGKEVVTCKTPFGTVGLSICYDLRFTELFRLLAMKGANMVFVPSAFTKKTGEAHWEILLRARAIENQFYVIAPAQTGDHNSKRSTYGNSMIVDPWGKVLSRAGDEETVITAGIDDGYLSLVRRSIPCLDHRRL